MDGQKNLYYPVVADKNVVKVCSGMLNFMYYDPIGSAQAKQLSTRRQT